MRLAKTFSIGIITLFIWTLLLGISPVARAADQTTTAKPVAAHVGRPAVVSAERAMSGPVLLKIPAIGLETVIEHVALDNQGRISVPRNVQDVAWFDGGARPGAPGNAVVVGHRDDYKGRPAAFWDLGKLRKDDAIIVVDADQTEHHFMVMGVESYREDQAPLNRIFGFDLERDLNLITCTGEWNRHTASYNKRLVVYARAVDK